MTQNSEKNTVGRIVDLGRPNLVELQQRIHKAYEELEAENKRLYGILKRMQLRSNHLNAFGLGFCKICSGLIDDALKGTDT